MKKLRILQICNRIPWPLNDGGNRVAWNTAKVLQDAGHTVELASLNTKKHFVDAGTVPGYSAIHTREIDTSPSALQAMLHLFSEVPYNIARFDSEDFRTLICERIQKGNFDLVQMEGSYLALYLPAIRAISGIPVVLRSHNVEFRIWKRMAEAEKHPLKALYFSRLAKGIEAFEKRTLSQFSAIAAITSVDAEWYRQNGYRGILREIPAGTEIHPPAQPGSHKPGSICFIGSLEWMPNVEGLDWFLENVWPLVRAQKPEAEFHLAGKNPPEKFAKMQVPGLHFHGEVPDADAFLSRFRLMVIPLLSGSGMRVKAAEAMGRGMTVVGTSVGLEGIAARNGQDLFIEDKAESMAKVLSDILYDTHVQEVVSQNALAFAKAHFSWDSVREKFEGMYGGLKI